MKRLRIGSGVAGLVLGMVSVGFTQAEINAQLYVYPSKGQSEAQQNDVE